MVLWIVHQWKLQCFAEQVRASSFRYKLHILHYNGYRSQHAHVTNNVDEDNGAIITVQRI